MLCTHWLFQENSDLDCIDTLNDVDPTMILLFSISVFSDSQTHGEKKAGNWVTSGGNGTSKNGEWTQTCRTSLRSISPRKWSQSHRCYEKVMVLFSFFPVFST